MKPRVKRFIKIGVLFIDEISGLPMVKLLDLKTDCTNTIKGKFMRNTGYLDVTNNSSETLILSKDEVLGIVDLKSIGNNEVKESIIWHHLQYHYEYKSLQEIV